MARRLKPHPAKSRTTQTPRETPRRQKPRRGLQLLVWALVLTVFCGMALLSGQKLGLGSGTGTSASSAPAAPLPAAVPGAAGGRLLAAPMTPTAPDPPGGGGNVNVCAKWNEQRDFLPLNRWTSFQLHTVDNAWLIKVKLFLSMIASLMFMAAGLLWRLIGMLMGFSYTFDMVCTAAAPINSAVGTIALFASWFLIPAWLVVLAAAVKRWSSGDKQGPGSAVRLLLVFATATGMIFFIADQSDKNQSNPTGKYTVPWMATTVQGWFGRASESLTGLADLANSQSNPVFYDNDPKAGAGPVTCAALDQKLYEIYRKDNANTGIKEGLGAMEQVSRIWEISLVRSWEAAQFGEGSKLYPSPAHAACRALEANSGVRPESKFKAYDLATGNPEGTTKASQWRGYFISPAAGEQTIMIAWGACRADDNGKGSGDGDAKRGKLLTQWEKVNGKDMGGRGPNRACGELYSEGGVSTGLKGFLTQLVTGSGDVGAFYFNGGDELRDKLGACVPNEEACQYNWAFVEAWLGGNQATRLTQGLMALIVSVVFLFVLGPMAVGLMLISVALAGLVMILPVTLLLLALGADQGKRLMKLTGAAAAGKFIFTIALTFLMMLIRVTYTAIEQTLGTDAPNFFEQVAQGAAPLAALWLFKKLSKVMGMGNISSLTGALGFAGAAALKATGDKQLSRNADSRMSSAIGRIGVGNKRLGALDERSLQRRMVDNKATRALTGAVGRGAKRVTRPFTDWAKDKRDSGRAGLLRMGHNLQQKAKSGSPAQRAAAYAGLTAGVAALSAVAPPVGVATLPLLFATGFSAGKHVFGRDEPGLNGTAAGLAPGSAAGTPLAKSARSALREADDFHRNIVRVTDPQERRALAAGHATEALAMSRARQWGAGYDGGLNTEFGGFATDDDKFRALTEMAEQMGLSPDRLMIGNHALVMPVPVQIDKRTGQRVFAAGTTIEQASHPVHYLDRYDLRRQTVNGHEESDDEYVVRLTAQLRERGYVNDHGEFVDVFQAHGYDTRDPKTRERVAAFISGHRDEELSQIVIRARRSEDTAISASREWASAQLPQFDQRQSREADVVQLVMDAARHDVGDFHQMPVRRPDGVSATAGEIKVQLEHRFTAMEDLLSQAKSLHSQQGTLNPDDFQVKLTELNGRHSGVAREIDELSGVLRDAVDASTQARGVCDLRVQFADSGRSVDTAELRQIAERLNDSMRSQQASWHELIDKQAGGLYRAPSSGDDVDRLADTLRELKNVFEGRIQNEQTQNQSVISKLERMQQVIQNNEGVHASDPRTSANSPIDIRKLLDEMYGRELTKSS